MTQENIQETTVQETNSEINAEDMPDFLQEALAEADTEIPDAPYTDPETPEELLEKEETKEEETPEEKQEVDEAEWKRIDRKVTKKFHRLQKEKEEFETKQQEFAKVVKFAKENPIEFLNQFGLTINDWAEAQLKPASEVDILRQEIEKERQEKQKILTQQQQEQYWNNLTNSVKSYFTESADQYSNTNALVQAGHLPNFYDVLANDVQTIYEETGQKPDLDDILSKYEEYYTNVVNALTKQTQQAGRGKKPAPTQFSQKQRTHASVNLDKADVSDPDELKAMVAKQFGFSI